ncbi:hypothetical protein Ciccas_004357 [Cichlidogyrus casuarinus]|uniref:Uncharacterized protein n=1 Tax=Cichlidogyrus casuarinus TaxID=1844966 RepID=A0ABD2QBW4_9PLAT
MEDVSSGSSKEEIELPLAIVENEMDDSPPVSFVQVNHSGLISKVLIEEVLPEVEIPRTSEVADVPQTMPQLDTDEINSDGTSFVDVVNNSDDKISLKTPESSPHKSLSDLTPKAERKMEAKSEQVLEEEPEEDEVLPLEVVIEEPVEKSPTSEERSKVEEREVPQIISKPPQW